ncbi:hypothetical protein LTR70_010738 [Exophiala xenobiotica]|nr:hypothetical protein LTR70_010738 [Exophiala xenobiotica]
MGADAQPLLILPACDRNDTIDHEIARIACAVVACNEFDGSSQLTSVGIAEFTKRSCSSLRKGTSSTYPSKPLPPPWRDCPIPDALASSGRLTSVIAHSIIKPDGTCRITNCTEQTEAAHNIPEAESEWFQSRGLTRRAKMEDESNFLLLKVTCISNAGTRTLRGVDEAKGRRRLKEQRLTKEKEMELRGGQAVGGQEAQPH